MTRPHLPIIAMNADLKPAYNGVPSVLYNFTGYSKSILGAGGIPIILPLTNGDALLEILDLVDGVVMVGGADLDPRNDGFMLHPNVRPMARSREKFDRELIAEVAKRRLPVLGIGVGMQLLNVSQGGTLFLHIKEDIPGALPHRDSMDPSHRHGLIVEKGSLLDAVYGDADIRVSSMHHMAVDDVAPNFLVTARCPGDNVVEAIESTRDDWFAVGVQFHPESSAATVLDQRVFQEFIQGIVSFKETGRNPFGWEPSKPGRKPTSTKSAQSLFYPSESPDSTFI